MEAYMGMITAFGFNFAPRNFAQCMGQTLSISQNTALFSLLGTTYGGNGQTTFALPDLRGRVPLGQGAGPGLSTYTLGEVGGSEHVSLTVGQLPPHTHPATANSTSTSQSASTLNGEGGAANASAAVGHLLSGSGVNNPIYSDQTNNLKAMASQSVSTTTTTTTNTTVTVQAAGSGQPTPVLQPYLCLNYCICTLGIFPSRN